MLGSDYLISAARFLVDLLCWLYLVALMLRFLLQLVRADFYNPICQVLVSLTNPVLLFLRRWLPAYLGVDWPLILFMVLVKLLGLCLDTLLLHGQLPPVAGLPILVTGGLLQLLIDIYIFIIVIQIVISWVQPGVHTKVTVLLYQLSDPLYRLVRRYVPLTHGIDWSPMIILILLNLMLILFIAPLYDLGNYLGR